MNILIVDDHRIFLDSLAMLIEKQVPQSVIHKVFDGVQAIQMLNTIKPAIVILDVNMPFMNGLEVAEYIHTTLPQTKIIVLTNVNGKAMVLNLTRVVHGFLFKAIEGNELKQCIHAVLAGEKYFCENSRKMVLNNTESLTDLPSVHLSKRELSIVELLAEGKTSGEIAQILGIKEKTIKSYREELLRKTKTKNTSELVVFAIHNSLILQI